MAHLGQTENDYYESDEDEEVFDHDPDDDGQAIRDRQYDGYYD